MTSINLPTMLAADRPLHRARLQEIPRQAARAAAHNSTEEAPRGRFVAMGLLLSGALVGAAAAINDGRLHHLGVQWLTLGLLSMACGLLLCRSTVARGGVSLSLLSTAAAIVVAFQLAHLWLCGVQTSAGGNLPVEALRSCVVVFGLGVAVALLTRRQALGGAIVVAAFATAAFAAIWTHPHPRIDVWMFQTESAQALLDGGHPYGVRYRDVYWPAGTADFYGPGASVDGWLTYSFPYPPASLLLVLPGQLAGDVRYAHAAALSVAGALLMLTARNRLGVLLGACLLSSPRALLTVTMGWTEPLLLLASAATAFAGVRAGGRGLWATIGLWVALKQYMILLVPMLRLIGPTLGSRRRWRQTVLAAALLAGALTVPFFATRPGAFVDATVRWQFIQPFRYDALSYPAMTAQLGGGESSSPLLPLSAAGAAILLAWWKAPRGVGGLLAASAVVFGVFFAFSKQAFCNYYLLVCGLCFCAVAALATSPHGAIARDRGGKIV